MTAICDLAARNGIYVISDEIYRGLEWSGELSPVGRQPLRARRLHQQRLQDAGHERHPARLDGLAGSRSDRAVPQPQVLHDAPSAEPARRDGRHGRAGAGKYWSLVNGTMEAAAAQLRGGLPLDGRATASSAGCRQPAGSWPSRRTISTFPPGISASACCRSRIAPISFPVAATATKGTCASASDPAHRWRPSKPAWSKSIASWPTIGPRRRPLAMAATA